MDNFEKFVWGVFTIVTMALSIGICAIIQRGCESADKDVCVDTNILILNNRTGDEVASRCNTSIHRVRDRLDNALNMPHSSEIVDHLSKMKDDLGTRGQ